MSDIAFNPRFQQTTPDGKMNYIGAVIKYFDYYTKGCEKTTLEIYKKNYEEIIFPIISPGKPIEEYDDSYIEELLRLIQKRNSFRDSTIISRYRHLVIDPCDTYFNDKTVVNPEENPLWGAAYKFSTDNASDGVESTLLRIPKSLDLTQELKAADDLLDPATADGAKIGLAIMLCCGVRNNEAVGFNFGDITELLDYPGNYVLRLTKTSIHNSNLRKAGGKTWNAPRRLPLIRRFAKFLFERKAFLASAMEFPYSDKNGTVFSSVEDLPIACRKADYTTACSASDLTKAGRIFLRDVLKLREQDVSGISYIVQNSEYESMGKDPTTYILRRNFATHLYTLGFPIEWCQYCMGHLIEDDVLKRSDFNDERFLYEMARLLERHPLNETECGPERITIPAFGSRRKYILIENTELNDPITVTITCDGGDAEIVAAKSLRSFPQEIDISKAINSPRERN